MSARRIAALALTGAVVAGGAGAAVAAVSRDSGKQREQAILDNAAKRLNVSPERLRDALSAAENDQLDQAVKDGRLTQEQAAAIKARRAQSGRVLGGPPLAGPRGHRGGRFGPGHGIGFRGDVIASLTKALGVTRTELREQLRAGKSIADIAKAQGRSPAGVRAALKSDAKTRLDKAVKDGDLTQAQADRLLARIDKMLEHLDQRPRLQRRFR